MRKLGVVLGSIALVAMTACGHIGLGKNENDVEIEFNNQSTEQATLYVLSSSEEIRLGQVTSGRSETFRVPEAVAIRGTVNFAVRMLARSETPTTGPLTIRPGESYVITLPPSRAALTILPGN